MRLWTANTLPQLWLFSPQRLSCVITTEIYVITAVTLDTVYMENARAPADGNEFWADDHFLARHWSYYRMSVGYFDFTIIMKYMSSQALSLHRTTEGLIMCTRLHYSYIIVISLSVLIMLSIFYIFYIMYIRGVGDEKIPLVPKST